MSYSLKSFQLVLRTIPYTLTSQAVTTEQTPEIKKKWQHARKKKMAAVYLFHQSPSSDEIYQPEN